MLSTLGREVKGEINGAHAGRYSSILRHASSLCVDQPPPTVVIETQNNSTIVRDYNNVVVVMLKQKVLLREL